MELCSKHDCILRGKMVRVPFRGDHKNVSIMFVGESPGRKEEIAGASFVGPSGELLYKLAAKAGLFRYNAFIANSAMCRIPKEDLKAKEINLILKQCRGHLEKEILALKPKVIIALGALAAQQLVKLKSLGDARGTFIWSEEFNCYVMPSFHPSFGLRKPSAIDILAADFFRVGTFLASKGKILSSEEIMIEERESIADIIAGNNTVAVDTETQGLDYINPTNIMISYSVSDTPNRAYQVFLHEECKESEADFFIPWERGKGKRNKHWTNIPVKKCSNFDNKVRELGELLASRTIKKVMMNGNYDIHHIISLFKNNGFSRPEINNYTLDVQLLSQCLEENLYARSSLELLRKSFTTLNTQYSDKFGEDFDKGDMLSVPKEDLAQYAAADACVTLNVARGLVAALKKEKEYEKLLFYFNHMVMPVTQKVILTMEENGVRTDMATLPTVREELQRELDYLYLKIIASIPHKIKDKYKDKRTPEAPLTKLNMIKEMVYSKEGFGVKKLKDQHTGKEIDGFDKKVRQELVSKKINSKALSFIDDYNRWKMIDTLISKYISSIEKVTRIDGRIHPSFSLAVAATGRTSCLTGDTLVTVLDERGLVKIKDIKVGDWVWSFDNNLQPVPTQVKWQGKTGEKSKVITVLYKTQGSRENKRIRCTPEHLFMLRDGSYAAAESLKAGDRLMAIERADICDGAYRRMWYTGNKGEIREHQQVMLSIGQGKSSHQRHIHHINKISLDNRPTNLLFVSSGREHCSYYPKTEEQKELLDFDDNHTVVAVDNDTDTFEDVFDITIEGPPNFIANGVCVHNSSNPNLQNIPKRGPIAKTIRKLFIASPGYRFVSADASQAELRWLAFLSQDPVMLDIYRSGGDIHATTAEATTGKTKAQMTVEEFKVARQSSKAVNFGFIYGAGWRTFQRSAKNDYGVLLTDKQAQEFREIFFKKYPAIRGYHRSVIQECHSKGYVMSPLGRVRRLPDIRSRDATVANRAERQALNHAIQGVSSDTVLLACLEIMKVADLSECRPVLFIHDELIFEVKEDVIDKYAKIIKYHMINPPLAQFGLELNIPFGSDCKVGTSLAEMEEYTNN